MVDTLTARQTQILKVLIDEYIETANPVGSEALEKKYDLGVSPATIRNEMLLLTKMGYLRQPHTSAGRVPSPKAVKFYIDQLMEEKQMSITDEVKAKEEVWDARGDINSLLKEAAQVLSQQTGNLSVAVMDDGSVWHSGYSRVFAYPEFADVEVCMNLFGMIEEAQRMGELFFNRMSGESSVEVIFGEELGWKGLSPVSIVGTTFSVDGHNAGLGVIGPTRTRYPIVIPVLRYLGSLVQEIASTAR